MSAECPAFSISLLLQLAVSLSLASRWGVKGHLMKPSLVYCLQQMSVIRAACRKLPVAPDDAKRRQDRRGGVGGARCSGVILSCSSSALL